MIRRALLFDDTAPAFLFMIQTPDGAWHADLTMLDYWRTTVNTPAQINIYSIAPTDSFVSINRMGAPLEWDTLSFAEYDQIRSLVARPWIPTALIYTTIPIHEIVDFDEWSRGTATAITTPAPDHWNAVRRPILDGVPVRRPWEPYMLTVPSPPQPQQAPPPPATQTQSQTPTPTALPPHVAATMIAAAVRAGATCPITLDTIDAADATVTSCGHVFTATALQRWLVTHTHCPECRNPLTS
jgi:hypothetical protein